MFTRNHYLSQCGIFLTVGVNMLVPMQCHLSSDKKDCNVVRQKNIVEESKKLKGFYDSIKLHVSGITEPHARQNLIIKLYESFFPRHFKRQPINLRLFMLLLRVWILLFVLLMIFQERNLEKTWDYMVFLFLIKNQRNEKPRIFI
ncbi:hypothetical protein ME1_01167 [Bartonella vinsonii subsp. arupensis OK-94-513]|uniref:Uncharacterized protein n=1 Tax=Bartonella vinsonii subsp. arupensis OK-94-513 TaxID=1094562 RepID=J1JSX9_BARVI|nr:hypothetical protein ME1_01167 [Bartonella vinsonii subsp. arupensis OK-94-513]